MTTSLRHSKQVESDEFEPASAEQLDQFREVLDILVRQVKSLEDRFTEVPKRAEFESMVGRSTDHAVDRLLLSLNHSVKPMLMANSQQQQSTAGRQGSVSSPTSRRPSNIDLQAFGLDRLGASWLQAEAKEAANEAAAQAAVLAAARHADGRRGSCAAQGQGSPPDRRRSGPSQSCSADGANCSSEAKPRRGSIGACMARRISIGDIGSRAGSIKRSSVTRMVIARAGCGGAEKVVPDAVETNVDSGEKASYCSPKGGLSLSPAVAATAAAICPEEAGDAGDAAAVKTEASSPPHAATRATLTSGEGTWPNDQDSGCIIQKQKVNEGSINAAAEASKLGQACSVAEVCSSSTPPSSGHTSDNGGFHQRTGLVDVTDDKREQSRSRRGALARIETTSVLEEAAQGGPRTTFTEAGTLKGSALRWFLLPTSRGRLTWDLIVMLMALLSALLAPVQLAFWTDVRTSWLRCVLGLCINVVWLLHVVINFRTGFEKEGVIVTTPRAVAMRYLKSAFGFDLLCCWPDELVLLTSGLASPGGGVDSADRSEHLRSPAFFLLFLKAFCVLALVRCFQTQETHGNINPGLLRLTRVIMILILTCHWVGCLWWLIAEIEGPGVVMEEDNMWVPLEWRELLLPGPTAHTLSPAPLSSKYVHALFWGVSLVSGITVMEFEPVTDLEMAYTIVCVLSGLGIYCYVLSSATAAVTRIDSRDSGHREQLEQIDRFLRFKRVSERVRTRIADFLDFIHTTASTDGLDFMRMLPVTLQAQLSLALNMQCLTRVPILQRCTADVDSSVMVALVMKLTTAIHLPQDVVLRQGEMCSSLGFINRGMLELITNMGAPTETVLQVLQDNEFWGQVMLVLDRPAQCSVRSISYSDVMSLNREDMMEALSSATNSLSILGKLRPDLHTMTDSVSGDLADMEHKIMQRQRTRWLCAGNDGGAPWARLRARVKGNINLVEGATGGSKSGPRATLVGSLRRTSCSGRGSEVKKAAIAESSGRDDDEAEGR